MGGGLCVVFKALIRLVDLKMHKYVFRDIDWIPVVVLKIRKCPIHVFRLLAGIL